MTKQEYVRQQEEQNGQQFQDNSGLDRLFLWQTKLPPQLSDEQSGALLKEYKKTKSKKFLQQAVCGNLRAVAAFCNENGLCHEDDFQQAALVATEAAKAFGHSQEESFSAFLAQRLEKSFQTQNGEFSLNEEISLNSETFSEQSDLGNVDENVHETFKENANKSKKENTHKNIHQNAHEDTHAQSAEIVNISHFLAENANAFEDETFSDGGKTVENIHNILEVNFLRNNLFPLLPEMQRKIFDAYYFSGQSLVEIGKNFGFSKQRVFEILQYAKNRLKKAYNYGLDRGAHFTKKFVAKDGKSYTPDQVNQAIKRFKPRDQILFWQYYENHLSEQEIAQKYGITPRYVNLLLGKIYFQLTQTKRNGICLQPKPVCHKVKQRLVFYCGGKKYTYSQLKKYLIFFDYFEQKIFQEFYQNGATQARIAQNLKIPTDEVFTTLKAMREKLFLIKKVGLESALEIFQRSKTIALASLYKTTNRSLSVVDVNKFWSKLGDKEKQIFVKTILQKTNNKNKEK